MNNPLGAPFSRRTAVLGLAGAGISALLLDASPSAARASGAGTTARAVASGSATRSRTFFVDATGADSATGLGETAAWRTPDRVNQAIASGEVVRGDHVLFKRGAAFYGILRPGPSTGTGDPLVFGAWGEGSKPIITTYKYVDDPSGWRPVGPDLWALDISARAAGQTHNGFVSSWSTEVGFLKVDGKIRGDRRTTVAALEREWQFCSLGSVVTVRSIGNPSAAGRTVWLAVAEPIALGESGVSYEGLDLRGTGRNAVQASSARAVAGLVVRDCTVSEVGGGMLSTSRYGNGVQIWSGARDVLVERCDISDCWDVAMTAQGTMTAASPPWRNVVFQDNVADRCMQSFEYWSTGTPTSANAGADVTFRRNTCSRAGSSWSATLRQDRLGKGTHLLFYRDDARTKVTVTSNRFEGALNNYMYASPVIPADLRSTENQINLAAKTKMQFGSPEGPFEFRAWRDRTGQELYSEVGLYVG